MTLRLALVIDGNPEGAKKALEETAAGLDKAGAAAERAGKKFEWLEPVATSADKAAGPIKEVGDSLGKAADEAPRAASRVTNFGDAAGGASGKITSLSSAAIGFVGGLAGAFAANAIGALIDGAAGAFANWVAEIASAAPRIKRDLEEHEGLIKRIKGAYAEAQGAASSYGKESAALLGFQAQQDKARLSRDYEAAVNDFDGKGVFSPLALQNGVESFRDTFGPVTDSILKMREQLAAGKADVIAFRNEIAAGAKTLPQESPIRASVEKLLADTEVAANVQAELERSKDLLKGIEGDANAAATALGGSAEKYGQIGQAAGGAAPALGETAGQIQATGDAATGAVEKLNQFEQLLQSLANYKPIAIDLRARTGTDGGTAPRNRGEFAAGGWTGNGGVNEPAGIVHGQEYVMDAESTRRIGVDTLDAMRRGVKGYAAGGFVAPAGTQRRGTDGRFQSASQSGDMGDILLGGFRTFLSEIVNAARDGSVDFWETFKNAGLSVAEQLLQGWLDSMLSSAGGQGGGTGGGGFMDFIRGLFGGFRETGGGFKALIGYAGGTESAAPGLAWVGENGRELVDFGGGGQRVYSASRSQEMANWTRGDYGGRNGGASEPTQIVFQNLGTNQRLVDRKSEPDGKGGRIETFILDDQVSALASNPSSQTHRTLGAMGSEPRRPLR